MDHPGHANESGEGHALLVQSAKAGDAQAMRALGNRLLDGKGVACDPAEGERWLRKAAATGAAAAQLSLAGRLLDGAGVGRNVREGEALLRAAAEAGRVEAMWALGERLFDGKGLARDPAEGERWFRKAAESGSAVAQFLLAERLLNGVGAVQNPAGGNFSVWIRPSRPPGGAVTTRNRREGEALLRAAAEAQYPPAMAELSDLILSGSIPSTDPHEAERWFRQAMAAGTCQANLGLLLYRQGRLAEAVDVFLTMYRDGNTVTGINLAYMLRRGEIPTACGITHAELLASALAEGQIVAVINAALARAAGFQCDADWAAADQMIRGLPREPMPEDLPETVVWWNDLTDRGDPEGDLVLAWLARHGLAVDPGGLSLPERMARARRGPWAGAPEWLDTPASQTPHGEAV